MLVGDWMDQWAAIFPDKTAVVFNEMVLTYRKFSERINAAAKFFDALGVKKGGRVAALLYNKPQYLEIFFALSKLGAILVPINWRLVAPEVSHILQDSQSEIMLFESRFKPLVAEVQDQGTSQIRQFISLGERPPTWAEDYEAGLARSRPGLRPSAAGVDQEDAHIIMYTSGTTGQPKGAVMSQRKTFFNVLNSDIYYALTPSDVILVTRPLFHSGGLLVQAAPVLYKGGTVILQERFRPELALEALETNRVTVFEAASTMYKFFLADCDMSAYDLSSLKVCYTGGERVSPGLITEFHQRGITIGQIFGQTETSTVTWLPREDAIRKIGSVGHPVFHGRVKIENEQGQAIQPGETGEILVGGPIIMTEYWNSPEMTAETIKAGWLHTGDLATQDEDGYIYIVDRKKNMIISGGENIYPAEVEKAILEHEAVEDVAVYGVPDERWGEVGRAAVVLKPGWKVNDEELLTFLRGRIAGYKKPKSVEFVSCLPRTAAGKIMRCKLTEGSQTPVD
ncbi:MAG: long-chain fatty acid--CoA ligase [Deltaproteobacteria bacterium]|nr:long-chain fatty acid--CoA ligase [Deltaproteobacteria bacterium]